ncbi:MAG: ABC transporter ATP-binding protein [Alphaproteobacteria bacterium]|nr:ABC transporter ATP-binding protein [Alphaproteobacteria bacterium]
MIEVTDLVKRFGKLTAVDGVRFSTGPGEIYGLLGPNGAGKSTTISCISGLLKPDGGKITINGYDSVGAGRLARQSLGIVPQDLALFEDLPARANLAYWGAAYGLRGRALKARVAEVLEVIGLADRAGDRPKTFSGGMKRRLNFGCGIVHEPKTLLLDEPTVGVDPQSRDNLLHLVREQAANGASILYTTHHMAEAETLCNRLAIIDHGKLIAQGSLADLRAQAGGRDIVEFKGVFSEDFRASAFDGKGMGGPGENGENGSISVLKADAETLVLEVANGPERIGAILEEIGRAGAEVHQTLVRQPSLESLFLKLTGTALRG